MTDTPSHVVWVNGRLYSEEEPAISPLDRGFTLGDGVFETMVAVRGRVFRLHRHLERLRQGGEVLEIPLPSMREMESTLQSLVAAQGDSRAVVRLTITRGPDTGRGVALPSNPTPTVAIRITPLAAYPPTKLPSLSATISSVRRNEGSPLSRIKSTNYGDSILARREAQKRGFDEAIMLNGKGEVACASTANLFIVRGGEVWTPPVESGVLPGITRECILELAQDLHIPVRQQPFGTDALFEAQEAFLTNTVMGIVVVTRGEEHSVGAGAPGPVTTKLAKAYGDVIRQELSL